MSFSFITNESQLYSVGPNCDPRTSTFDSNTCPDPSDIVVITMNGVASACSYHNSTGDLISTMKEGVRCPENIPPVMRSPDWSEYLFPVVVGAVVLYVISSSLKGFKKKFLF